MRSDQPRGLRSVLGDSVAYGISAGALPVAMVLATPFLTRTLDPDGYGTVDVLTALSSLAAIVSLIGMDNAVGRSWFDYGSSEQAARWAVVRTGVSVTAATSTVVAASAILLTLAADLNRTVTLAAITAFGVLPIMNAAALSRAAFLLPRRRGAYVLIGVTQAIAGVGLGTTLVILDHGPPGFFLGLGAGGVVALALGLAGGRFLGRTWIDRSELPRMLRYGLPLVPATAATWVIFAVDRTLVATLRDLEDAGLYGLATRVSAPLLLAVSAFAIAWGPFILAQAEQRRAELRARAMTAVMAATGALFVVLVLFAEPLVGLLGGADFEPGVRAVPGVALGWLGWAAATVLMSEFAVVRRTGVIAVLTAGCAVTNVALNLFLIPLFGFVGAAWATAASFLLLAVAAWWWERQITLTPYRWNRLGVLVLVGAAALVASVFSDGQLDLVFRFILCAVVAVVFGLVAATDRERGLIPSGTVP